jgi:ubiquinone/menaquinone biosynthesis C-methylase UbiE
MDSPMSDFMFNGMSFIFKLRDLIVPRKKVLEEVGIESGDRVLDYGCGPGTYTPDVAEMVGASGRVYALDIHPLAVRRVQDLAKRKQLTNVKTILSDCDTGLPDDSVDVVLLYDIFHLLNEPRAVLAELHRVLKPGGTLSFNDHHMKEDDIIVGMTEGLLFALSKQDERTYSFSPQRNGRQ